MKLILIHGRKQRNNGEILKNKKWMPAIIKGLKKNGHKMPIALEDVRLPFYARILTNSNRSRFFWFEKNFNENEQFHNFSIEVVKETMGYVETNLNAKNLPYTEVSNAREKLYQLDSIGGVTLQHLYELLRLLDQKTKIGSNVIRYFLKDVYRYLYNHNTRAEINGLIAQYIPNDEPCVIVAHSLGSIVGYDVMTTISNNWNVVKFITLGSPLGIRAVQSKLIAPHMPSCIQNGKWYNALDIADIVALNPLDNEHFNTNPAIRNNNRVNNTSPNSHKIPEYLSDKNVANEIYEGLVNI